MTDTPELRPALLLLMAVACGALVANIYYAQTLVAAIAPEIGLTPRLAGMVVTLTQLGYGLGLLLIVPLSDRLENKRLVLVATAGAALGGLGLATAHAPALFLAASLVTGLCSVGAQVLVPLASHLARPERQGRTIGFVMSGLLTGIMLARPMASFIAAAAGWRAVFVFSALLSAAIGLALAWMMPRRQPASGLSLGATLASMATLLRTHAPLRWRGAAQALLFLAFNLFWTAAPLVLIRQFALGQEGVALFALAGAGGALAAPLAGWLGDHGHGGAATWGARALLAVSFLAAGWAVAAHSLIAFAITGVLIDAAVQLHQITSQRIIYALDPGARGRLNAVYMAGIFVVGAFGSTLGSWSVAHGWWWSVAIGAGVGGVTLLMRLAGARNG